MYDNCLDVWNGAMKYMVLNGNPRQAEKSGLFVNG